MTSVEGAVKQRLEGKLRRLVAIAAETGPSAFLVEAIRFQPGKSYSSMFPRFGWFRRPGMGNEKSHYVADGSWNLLGTRKRSLPEMRPHGKFVWLRG
jgi:hypothetical protein